MKSNEKEVEELKLIDEMIGKKWNLLIIKTLFEMLATIQYNVNLRLQWEKCFIKIMRIQKG